MSLRIRRQPRQVVAQKAITHPVVASRRITSSARKRISVYVSCTVVDGSVSDDDLVEWLADAVDRYHIFRLGNVGYSAHGRITKPTLKRSI